jgi:hypothetical protein
VQADPAYVDWASAFDLVFILNLHLEWDWEIHWL